MKPLEIGEIYADIGRLIVKDLGINGEGAFLYAEAGRAWAGGGIFQDLGNRILYRDPSKELLDRIMDAWDATEADKKWEVMQYTVTNGMFKAAFEFPDELDPAEGGHWRRARVLRERYGDKPVDYSDPEPR